MSSFPLQALDNATELTPDHGDFVLPLAGLAGIVGLIVMWRATRNWKIATTQTQYKPSTATRVGVTMACAGMSFMALFGSSFTMTDIIEGRLDFPPSSTHTYDNTLVRISRAYRASAGKSGSYWAIQTAPIWSNMNISRHDYDFMLGHRSPNDYGTNADEITSKGYFCAKVTIQRSGRAIRVMHAGQGQLPVGSVLVCPPDFDSHPHI